jgi:general secretion pathway protein M
VLTGWVAELEATGILVEQLTTTDNGDRTVAAQMTLRARGQ